jgi:glycosyltransferase involved in cell wall biosynthesis
MPSKELGVMDVEELFPGRLAIQQRVLPAYRAPFFERLAEACQDGLSVFAGQPEPDEGILPAETLQNARLSRAQNRSFMKVGTPFYRCWQPGILEWLEAWDPQVLVVEANPRYPSTRHAVRWMHARRRPVLGWGLGAPKAAGLLGVIRMYNRQNFLSRLDGVIAYSQRGAQEYCEAGFSAERVFVALNAAAPAPENPPPERLPQFDPRPRVLFVGRLQARKRIDLLLQTCASLPASLQTELVIVGDGPALPELQDLAKRVYPLAKFTGGLFGSELDKVFTRADLFVLPGTGGLAIQQAMSFGLPVIAAQGDGTQDDLVRPENGWKIPPGDLKALTSALLEALSDPVRLRQKGAASYRIVAQEANLERMARSFIAAVKAVQRIIAGD